MKMLKSGKQGLPFFTIHLQYSLYIVLLAIIGVQMPRDIYAIVCRRLKIPIVREGYIGECVKKNKMLPFDLYKLENALESSKGSTVTVKVKGRSAVHESSGLQDTAHILEDGKSIYNATLNMSDLALGVNRLVIFFKHVWYSGSLCIIYLLEGLGTWKPSYLFSAFGVLNTHMVGRCSVTWGTQHLGSNS